MKKDDSKLKIYVIGILTIVAIIPLIESLVNVVLTWIEYLKTIPTKKILEENKEIQKLQSEIEPINTFAMGFQAPEDYVFEDDEFDDDEFEEECKNNNLKFGFHPTKK